jgi:hypothetical protein
MKKLPKYLVVFYMLVLQKMSELEATAHLASKSTEEKLACQAHTTDATRGMHEWTGQLENLMQSRNHHGIQPCSTRRSTCTHPSTHWQTMTLVSE